MGSLAPKKTKKVFAMQSQSLCATAALPCLDNIARKCALRRLPLNIELLLISNSRIFATFAPKCEWNVIVWTLTQGPNFYLGIFIDCGRCGIRFLVRKVRSDYFSLKATTLDTGGIRSHDPDTTRPRRQGKGWTIFFKDDPFFWETARVQVIGFFVFLS
jgi:hypothetical protein